MTADAVITIQEEFCMKQEEKTNRRLINDYDYLGKSCSVQDCTGLIPAAPKNQEELLAYEDVYPYLPPNTSDLYPSPFPSKGQGETPGEGSAESKLLNNTKC